MILRINLFKGKVNVTKVWLGWVYVFSIASFIFCELSSSKSSYKWQPIICPFGFIKYFYSGWIDIRYA